MQVEYTYEWYDVPTIDIRQPVRDMFTVKDEMRWDQLLTAINCGLGFDLRDDQIAFIFHGDDSILAGGRKNGKTIAVIVRKLLLAPSGVKYPISEPECRTIAITQHTAAIAQLLSHSGIPMPNVFTPGGRRIF